MTPQRIAEIALSFGYRPRLRKDGRMDLSSSLFNFANAVIAEHKKEVLPVLIASADVLEKYFPTNPTDDAAKHDAINLIIEYLE
jgi:hypothetical protein